jgi:hypothetical protein
MCYVVSIVRFARLPHVRDVEVASALTERTRLPPPSPLLLQLESLESLIAIAERIHDLVMRKYVPVPASLLSPLLNMPSAPCVTPHPGLPVTLVPTALCGRAAMSIPPITTLFAASVCCPEV